MNISNNNHIYSLMGNSQRATEPNYLSECNAGRKGGFGDAYVSEEQFKFGEVNEPTRNYSLFIILLIVSLCESFFLYGFYSEYFRHKSKDLFFFYIGYGSYLIVVYILSTQYPFIIANTQHYSHYQQVFSKSALSTCFFKFTIRCFHYQKLTTHTATSDYYCERVQDNSGEIKELKMKNKMVFVHYLKKYSFGDQPTKEQFRKSFNQFVSRNISDKRQEVSFSLEIPDYQQYVCYSNRDVRWLKYVYVVCSLVGMWAPFVLATETMLIERYDVKIHKILTN